MAIVLIAYALQVFLSQIISDIWWVPNLTLVGLVVGFSRNPARWLSLSSLCGILAMAWAIRSAAWVLLSYWMVGLVLRQVSFRWYVSDLRNQLLFCGIGAVWCAAGLIVADGLVSSQTMFLLLAHVLSTVLSAIPFSLMVRKL